MKLIISERIDNRITVDLHTGEIARDSNQHTNRFTLEDVQDENGNSIIVDDDWKRAVWCNLSEITELWALNAIDSDDNEVTSSGFEAMQSSQVFHP